MGTPIQPLAPSINGAASATAGSIASRRIVAGTVAVKLHHLQLSALAPQFAELSS
jgi:hypothetical protein